MPVATAASAPAQAAPYPKPLIRLRVVALLAFLAGAALWLKPRAVAAWQVHGMASALADYGACMVGPTGPSLLRNGAMAEFESLARRRLLAASPGDAPFARCGALAAKLSEGADAESAHGAPADQFREYGARASASLSLDALRIDPEPVKERARLAWPFVRDGYTKLVHLSLGAKEAIHPVAPPKPAVGRGLPGARALYSSALVRPEGLLLAHGKGARVGAYKSSDGGVTWRAWPTSGVDTVADRCAVDADGRGFALGTTLDGSSISVQSLVPGRDPVVAALAPLSHTPLATACDASALVVLTRGRDKRQELWLCEFEHACAKLEGPKLAGLSALDFPVDIARVSGTTVLALTMGQVVRVASSRDNGKSWTPLTVAYDDSEYLDFRPGVRLPTRLLAVGKRLFLFGSASKASQTYSLLYSDDQGASFRGL
ncbi:MAG TPA: hypothetical protein VM686_41575 [Polyangiaceae bacterium]|nr:hypothetical protein [Polyangiaceae bacterium]